MFDKNDHAELVITDMSVTGEGVGKADGFTFFVKDTVPGDRVLANITKVKKTFGYARLIEVLEPSPDRVPMFCPIARPCGGCTLQELSYPAQLRFKENLVRSSLLRIGGFSEQKLQSIMEPIIGMDQPLRYRNKAQFPVGFDKNGRLTAGFYASRTHTLVPVSDCLLGIEENELILQRILSWMESEENPPYDETYGTGCIRHILIRKGFHTGEIMVCLVVNDTIQGGEALREVLFDIPGMTSVSLNFNQDRTNVILGDKTVSLWGKPTITDYIGEIRFEISPQSFFQVNPVQTEKLYGKALEYASLTGKEVVWDLYCGIGTISLFLARKAALVYGVEVVPQAIRDARLNAKLNQIKNAEFFVGKAEERSLPGNPDVIVVDPPRKGCDEALLHTIVKAQPGRIVYVSCDPATLSRDLRFLCDEGYDLLEATPVDMFPETRHVETVCLLINRPH